MKKINQIIILFFLSVFLLTSCDDMLNVNSEQLTAEQDYQMKNTNDTLYSMFGVLSQLQKVADSYVLMGELRADLVSTNENSNKDLREINDLNISAGNKYAGFKRDLYSVINNCNYVINNIDTSLVKGGVKVMYKEFAACKAIRAWSYMQLMQNFGEATYYTSPILTVDDARKTYSVLTSMNELAPLLIADLNKWKDAPYPGLGYLSSYNTKKSYFPIRFVLGDLYLWTGEYEKAANEYRDLMFNDKILIDKTLRSKYEVINGEFTGKLFSDNNNYNWYDWLNYNSSEVITSIFATNQYTQNFTLDSINSINNPQIHSSDIAKTNWANQTYFETYIKDDKGNVTTLSRKGDLRAYGSYKMWSEAAKMEITMKNDLLVKYFLMNPTTFTNKQIVVYRAALLYLRYAEAVNLLGKPNLAFTVLKYGLTASTISSKVPAAEKDSILPNYMDFTSTKFNDNIGIRARACGNVMNDTTDFIIPKLDTKSDSMVYVENLIEKELALETAGEGNRFGDLMRFAIRRNDNAFLADKVAAKHTTNKAAIRTKLMDRANWFLK